MPFSMLRSAAPSDLKGRGSLVSKRERREGFDPSNPQTAGGEKVEPLLVARPLGARGAVPK